MWLGLAIESRPPLAGFQIDVPAELGGDHDLVSERRDAFAENSFHFVRAISLRRIEKGDATVKSRPDDVDHFRSVGDCRLVGAAHVLDAKADAGDFE